MPLSSPPQRLPSLLTLFTRILAFGALVPPLHEPLNEHVFGLDRRRLASSLPAAFLVDETLLAPLLVQHGVGEPTYPSVTTLSGAFPSAVEAWFDGWAGDGGPELRDVDDDVP